MQKILLPIILALHCGNLLADTFIPLLDNNTKTLLLNELSGELAKEHVIAITRHHRTQGSKQYRNAAEYVLQQLRASGFSKEDAYIETFKSDGKTHYQGWQSPSGWDIQSAELRMIEPYDEHIVSYPEIGMSVVTYSNPGHAKAELVWVDQGTDPKYYAGKDVKNKIVLASGYGGQVHRLAVLEYGAKAVISYLDDDRAKQYPDMLAYTGMWPMPNELKNTRFGFNISHRQGEKLRKLLASGQQVVMDATVTGNGLEPFFMDIVVAHIRGSEKPEKEMILSAHLDHPKESANDNASGSAALIDIAKALKTSIKKQNLPQPKTSLRFVWVPEWYGTMAYLDKHPEIKGPELGGRSLANLNLDMVGENLELIHSKMEITRTPRSVPSMIDHVIINMADMVDHMNIRTPRGSLSVFNYRQSRFMANSDHMMFIARKIPGVMLFHDPDYTHHTSEDTPDKVDPVELKRSEIIAAATSLYLANLNSTQAHELAHISAAYAALDLTTTYRKVTHQLQTLNGENKAARLEGLNQLQHVKNWNLQALYSIKNFHHDTSFESTLKLLSEQITQQYQNLTQQLSNTSSLLESYKTESLDQRIPKHRLSGPINKNTFFYSQKNNTWYQDNELDDEQFFELTNFIDGKKTISEIRNAYSAEFEPINTEIISRYMQDLSKQKLITLEP